MFQETSSEDHSLAHDGLPALILRFFIALESVSLRPA
jgi:hypothetical protein